jgi:hypothetical protein
MRREGLGVIQQRIQHGLESDALGHLGAFYGEESVSKANQAPTPDDATAWEPSLRSFEIIFTAN